MANKEKLKVKANNKIEGTVGQERKEAITWEAKEKRGKEKRTNYEIKDKEDREDIGRGKES